MDYLIRGLALDERVRIIGCISTKCCQEGSKRHKTNYLASIALGRTLTAASLMGIMLKGNEKLTIQINGNGPAGTIMADANAKGEVKGFIANPQAKTKTFDVSELVGNLGFLKVIKNVGMKESFCGDVLLQTGQIGDDLSYYFYISEQIPSVVALSVNLDQNGQIEVAGGYIIQLLPNANDDDFDYVEKVVSENSNLKEDLKNGLNIEEIIQKMFNDFKILDKQPLVYKCNCSKNKFARNIALIPKEEILNMIEVDHGCEAICNFCNKKYHFNEDDLYRIMERKQRS